MVNVGGGDEMGPERKARSVNGKTVPVEKLKHQSIDGLTQLLRYFYEMTGTVPQLFKADVDSAFRRIPIAAEHLWATGFAFLVKEQVGCLVSSVFHACC